MFAKRRMQAAPFVGAGDRAAATMKNVGEADSKGAKQGHRVISSPFEQKPPSAAADAAAAVNMPTFQIWSRSSHTFCTECEDTRATVFCLGCEEEYCSLCWAALHRRGDRAKHGTKSLGSQKDLAPPPEALEESGWLAGVWPSHRPTLEADVTNNGDCKGVFPAKVDTEGGLVEVAGATPNHAENGTYVGKDIVNGNAAPVSEDTAASAAASPAVLSAGVLTTVSNGTNGTIDEGAWGRKLSSMESTEGDDTKLSALPVNGVGNAVGNTVVGEKAAPTTSSVVSSSSSLSLSLSTSSVIGGMHPAMVDESGAGEASKERVGKANGAGRKGEAALTMKASKPAKRARSSNGNATGDTHSHSNGASKGRTREGDSKNISNTINTAAVRPAGLEGPLCPSGLFFSKRQLPSLSLETGGDGTRESDAKRARSSPNGRSPRGNGNDQGASRDRTVAGQPKAKGKPRSMIPNGGGPAEKNFSTENANGSGVSRGMNGDVLVGRGGERGRREAAGSKANGHANGHKRHDDHERPNAARGNGVGSVAIKAGGGMAAAAAATVKGATNGRLLPPPSTSSSSSLPSSLSSSSGVHHPAPSTVTPRTEASSANGAAHAKEDIQVRPMVNGAQAAEATSATAAAVLGEKAQQGVVLSSEVGTKAGAVGPARVPTETEALALSDLKRRSTNVPLRLDPREREVLGVLEGSLHHCQYTDEVDRIHRGSRIANVLKNLSEFFTSVWGMYKASGVAAPTYSAPPDPASTKRPLFNSNRLGVTSAHAFGKGRAMNGVGWSGSSRNGKALSAGGGAGVGGGAAYRGDSFKMKPNGWGYTKDWASVLRTCAEVGRRHKILNPEKMRSAHGMLMCVVTDSEHPHIREQTGFSCVRPMRTAFGLAASCGLLGLSEDPDLLKASRPVLPWTQVGFVEKKRKNAKQLALQAKEKAEARHRLLVRHGKGGLQSEVSLLVDSIADSIVYREISTRPIRRMLELLKHNWAPAKTGDGKKSASLAVRAGEHGSRLTHEHGTQYYFVLQSLTLWLEVVDNMLDLWAAGEKDMLSDGNQYSLKNTGQGLQRIQGASRVGALMNKYQGKVQKETSCRWVGSAVVHLGDNCVPNALTFLDKYSQVPWILNPILQAIDYLTDLENGSDPKILAFVLKRWPSVEFAKRCILRNFFRYAFDGSGGDNNYDAGSCVDGRLTSAWNWCSKIEKKTFFHLFKFSGFNGFDGDFSR